MPSISSSPVSFSTTAGPACRATAAKRRAIPAASCGNGSARSFGTEVPPDPHVPAVDVPALARAPATRRDRQLAEIWRLTERGHHRRAAGLATEHVEEFPCDAESLADVVRWFERGQPL